MVFACRPKRSPEVWGCTLLLVTNIHVLDLPQVLTGSAFCQCDQDIQTFFDEQTQYVLQEYGWFSKLVSPSGFHTKVGPKTHYFQMIPTFWDSSILNESTSAPLQGAFHWLPCTLSQALRSLRACSFSPAIIKHPRLASTASDLHKIQIELNPFDCFLCRKCLSSTSVVFLWGEPCLWAHSVLLADQPDDTGKVSSRRKNPSGKVLSNERNPNPHPNNISKTNYLIFLGRLPGWTLPFKESKQGTKGYVSRHVSSTRGPGGHRSWWPRRCQKRPEPWAVGMMP